VQKWHSATIAQARTHANTQTEASWRFKKSTPHGVTVVEGLLQVDGPRHDVVVEQTKIGLHKWRNGSTSTSKMSKLK
jgi:hypothetical protein